MRRDMDLVRQILLWATDEIQECPLDEAKASKEEKEIYYSHIEMMIDAGLLKGQVAKSLNGFHSCIITLVPWKGQDLLDAIMDDGIWQKTKRRIATVGGSASIEIVKAVAVDAMKQKLGLGD